MVSFIDKHRRKYGVEPICNVLPIAPSMYYRCKHLERHPDQRSRRIRRNEAMEREVSRVWEEQHSLYGARKVWKQLNRELIPVGRFTVERLMRKLGIQGVRRGRACKTTVSSEHSLKPLDLVNRQFKATRPNQLWVADISVPQKAA